MTEHIIANIEFSKKNQNSVSYHPLNFLSPYLGSANDIALVPIAPPQAFLEQIQQLKAPCLTIKTIDEIEKITVLNPWKITDEMIHLANHFQGMLKYPYSKLTETLDSKIELYRFFQNEHDIKIIENKQEIFFYLKDQSDLFVLKKEHGQSGQGHYFLNPQNLESTLHNFGLKGRYRLEKWYDRVFDFSTQWVLDDDVTLLGACELLNSPKGVYQASIFPLENRSYKPFINDHIAHARPVLEKIQKLGFKGHLGLDAFIYKSANTLKLYPVCEINPRKTMGYLALHLAKHYNQKIKLEIGNSQSCNCLLPKELLINDQVIRFKKNLTLFYL